MSDKGAGFTYNENGALIMKGAPVADALTAELALRAEALRERGIIPKLAILRVGEDPSDIAYENGAKKRAAKIGVEVKSILLPGDSCGQEILKCIDEVNSDESIHGFIMFRPLKDKNAEKEAVGRLDPVKDADCMTAVSQAAVYMDAENDIRAGACVYADSSSKSYGFAPCTAQAVIELLRFYGIEISGRHAVVVGRSEVIGKPVSMLLLKENATVTICHSKTVGMKEICKNADIIVAAVGRCEMLDESYLSQGQIVVDVGINTNSAGKLAGDVNEKAKEELAGAYTPVPGGVGAVTSAVLCKHVIEAAERTRG